MLSDKPVLWLAIFYSKSDPYIFLELSVCKIEKWKNVCNFVQVIIKIYKRYFSGRPAFPKGILKLGDFLALTNDATP